MAEHMGVILIVGRIEDPCCRLVNEQLTQAGRDVCVLPEDRLLPGLSFGWQPSRDTQPGNIKYHGREIDFTDISGILCRAWGVPVSPQDFETADGRYICAEWNALLMAWLHRMPCIVINRIKPELWYKAQLNVPDLAALVPDLGFRRPRSIVTTSSDDANEFCRSVRGPLRYSPLTRSSGYRIETEADREKLAALNGALPLYLTERVEGRALDAFVVGSEVVLVDNSGRLDGEDSSAVTKDCLEVSRALGLTFCRLSLVATPHGDWYCLGLDRTPQIYQCTPDAQRRIAQALVRALSPDTEPL